MKHQFGELDLTINQAYYKFDPHHGGTITRTDFCNRASAIGIKMSYNDLKSIFYWLQRYQNNGDKRQGTDTLRKFDREFKKTFKNLPPAGEKPLEIIKRKKT
jgi:hypothetical protein